jgi:excinuclease UvrABC nuclease subunit
MREYAVYCYFNKQNELLYIGMSAILAGRIYQHERESSWITQAAQIRIIWYKTRAKAQAAERHAILRYNPPYNRIVKRKRAIFRYKPRTIRKIKTWTSSIIQKNRDRRNQV